MRSGHEPARPAPGPAPAHKSLSRHVSDDLLDRIGSGQFRPGDRLPTEQELMLEYGVGRNAVREAVQGLVALGMLEVRPRRGAVVLAARPERVLPVDTLSALLDTPVVKDLYEVQMLLECRAARLAAQRHDEQELATIRDSLARFAYALDHDAPVWQADLDFHEAIARASGNTVLPRILEAAHGLLASARRTTGQVEEAVREALVDHTMIADAIDAGDADGAELAMRVHIGHGAAAYETALRRLGHTDIQ